MSNVYDHAIYRLLRDLGAIDPQHIEPYAPRVRDRDDIAVYRCARSGVIFLARIDQTDVAYYADKDTASGTLVADEKDVPFFHLQNAARQAEAFRHLIRGKRWLDVGCGSGALLGLLGGEAEKARGVEPNIIHRQAAVGVDIVPDLADVGEEAWDVISMFHVLEHLPDPVAMAARLRGMLRPDGLLLIEVPHARDFLLQTLDCAEFRRFTLWSEHLVLHTRNSLEKVLRAAGFKTVEVQGYQRFPLSNHLYWLRHGQPGGHERWGFLDTPALIATYAASLEKLDQTDTLIALARI